MKRSIAAVLMASTALVASAAEPGVFIDLKDVPLPEAAAFVGRITSHRIELGPGATGRITMSSPRALTYDELLVVFDNELSRNGLTAIKRGRDMLIVAAAPASRAPAPVAAVTPAFAPAPVSMPISYIASSESRARALITRLQGGGVTARLALASADPEDGFAVEIAVPVDPAARRDLAGRIAALDLGALFTIQP
ncbi:hypothetical protein BH10PSE17_BH10PSE17_37460 [soil metagenome]